MSELDCSNRESSRCGGGSTSDDSTDSGTGVPTANERAGDEGERAKSIADGGYSKIADREYLEAADNEDDSSMRSGPSNMNGDASWLFPMTGNSVHFPS